MVVVFGTVCLDRILRVAGLPAQGGYVEIEDELLMLGGEAANTALALQAWGAEIELFPNAIGSGADADLLRDLIRRKGLPTRFLREGTAPTPVCDVYVTPAGERTMFGRGFKDMDGATDLNSMPVHSGEWFTAEPNMSALAREAVRRAAAAGMKVYTMDFVRPDDSIPAGSYWQSSTDWAGARGDVEANRAWVREWVDRHGCCAILTDGSNGFVAGSPECTPKHYPAYPCPNPVDSTGAGDAFRAGMLVCLDRGRAIADCLRFASAAGSLKCRRLGATAQPASVPEIRAHLAAHAALGEAYETELGERPLG